MEIIKYDEVSFVIHSKLKNTYVGYISVNWNYVAKIYVLPEHRMKGIGSTLLRSAENKVKSLGFSEIQLDCIPEDKMTKLEEFYFKNGYSLKDGNRFYKNL